MAGYRVNAGVGILDRTNCSEDFQKPDVLPDNNEDGVAIPIFSSTATKGDKTDCLHQLTHRMGAGLTLSIDRARNLNYITELGQREYSTATSGMYDVSFSLDGIFTPEYCGELMSNVFMMGPGNNDVSHASPFEIKSTTTVNVYSSKDFSTDNAVGTLKQFAKKEGESDPEIVADNSALYYVCQTVDGVTIKFSKGILGKDLANYAEFIYGFKTDKTSGKQVAREGKLSLFGYNNLEGPKYFDMGYQKINAHASGVYQYDGRNELGVLLGCIIDTASVSYDSGSDAGVHFSITGFALVDYEFITESSFDYASILDDIPRNVFVGGCVSVFDKSDKAYVPIAQTDSASVQINNAVSKRGNCLKLNYSSYSLGSLGYNVSMSTYSNDPNKVFKYFYGYSDDMEEGETMFIGKQPIPISYMKIRTDDTSARVAKGEETMFMDINMTDVYVGDMSSDFSIDNPIMDAPQMRAKYMYMAVGYTP